MTRRKWRISKKRQSLQQQEINWTERFPLSLSSSLISWCQWIQKNTFWVMSSQWNTLLLKPNGGEVLRILSQATSSCSSFCCHISWHHLESGERLDYQKKKVNLVTLKETIILASFHILSLLVHPSFFHCYERLLSPFFWNFMFQVKRSVEEHILTGGDIRQQRQDCINSIHSGEKIGE